MLPLPNYITDEIVNLKTPNLSLAYYKLADVYNQYWKLTEDKKGFLQKFVNYSKIKAYRNSFETRKRFLEQIGTGFSMITAKRLLFGVGYSHPFEIGFSFDWTTGLPIIPGSSLKGVAWDTSVLYKDELNVDKELRTILFGSKDSEHTLKVPEQAGRIIFFPAYPCPVDGEEFFDIDVMTPHYQKYYENPKDNPPADWYSPIPLPFLTVKKEVQYCFRLADRIDLNAKEENSELLTIAVKILKMALTEHGVGAKTRVDYGYFK